jgi:hypothetical protein
MTVPAREDRVRRRAGIEMRSLPKGALLVDLNSGRCFRLNPVGAEIWSLLSETVACGDVYAAIARRYQLPAAQAEAEVGALLGELLGGELVELVGGESSP